MQIYITLPVVLYRYETWSLTFRDKYRLSVVENSVVRKILALRGISYSRMEKVE
jgi:hypothetical protein